MHGITSFGPIGCVFDKKPSVFTRSSAYLPWIQNIIRKDIYDLIGMYVSIAGRENLEYFRMDFKKHSLFLKVLVVAD